MYFSTQNRIETTRHSCPSLIAALALLLLLASCGGGGEGNGQPDPQPNFPDPVEELGDNDIANAGLPDINSLASISSKSSSMLTIPEEHKLVLNLSLGWDAVIASRNLVEAGDGGWQVSAPESETKRVLAWAIYEIPAGSDAHLFSKAYDLNPNELSFRLFFAMANQTKGGWELGGRLASSGGGGIFNNGGTLNFSQSEDYVMPNGSSYLALLVGHPGDGNYNGITLGYTEVEWTYLMDSASENFPDEDYSMQWGEDSFSMILDGTSNTLAFNIGMPPTLNSRLLIGTHPGQQLALASQWTNHNDSDPGIHWFDVNAANGRAHEYAYTQLIDDSEMFVSGAPLLDLNGNGTANGIIGILVGLQGPIPNQPVAFYIDDFIIGNTTTNNLGRFSLDGLEEGSYDLVIGNPDNPIMEYTYDVDFLGGVYVGLLLPAVQK